MTIINTLVHRGGAVLFADTAASDEDGGALTGFASKIETVDGSRFGWMGSGSSAACEFVRQALPADIDFDYACTALPHILRVWLAVSTEKLGEAANLRVQFAGWSKRKQEWRGAIVDSDDVPGRPAMHVADAGIHIGVVAIGEELRQLSEEEIMQNVLALGIDEFARRVLNASRRAVALHEGRCPSGGSGELVSITQRGVERRMIITWPDAVGDSTAEVAARVLAQPAPEFLPAA